MKVPRIPLIALTPHAAEPPVAVTGVSAGCFLASDTTLALRYLIRGELEQLQWPTACGGNRSDGLWEHTCCEAFIATGAGAYVELNFAPNGDWAAYRFAGYRERGADPDMPAPHLRTRRGRGWFELDVLVEAGNWLPQEAAWPLRIALTAVVAERGNTRSYWALRHRGERADFHDMDGFMLQLARDAVPASRQGQAL